MRVLVSGATGFIGRPLCERLAGDGHDVVRLVRKRAPGPGPQLSWSELNADAVSGIDAAINLAGASIAGGRWTRARKAELIESRVDTTNRLAGVLASAAPPPRVLVSLSAVGFYGDRGDEVLGEDSAQGEGFLADLCARWERATEPAEAAGIRTVHLRQGIVLGPGGGALAPQLKLFRLGLGGKLGSGRQWLSWISLADAIAVMLHAISAEGLQGVVNSVAPAPVTNSTFTSELAKALHRPAVLPVPAAALRLAMGELADELILASQRATTRLPDSGYRFEHDSISAALDVVVNR